MPSRGAARRRASVKRAVRALALVLFACVLVAFARSRTRGVASARDGNARATVSIETTSSSRRIARDVRRGTETPTTATADADATRDEATVDDGADGATRDDDRRRRGGASDKPTTWARVGADSRRRRAVREAMREAFGAYLSYARGHDELAPMSKTGRDDFGGVGATLVDALDTLHIMGLTREFKEALSCLKGSEGVGFRDLIHGVTDRDVSVFETNIRVIGGLLSTHDLTGDADVLELAESMASRLSAAFHTASGVPRSFVNVKTGRAFGLPWTSGNSILADFGSMHLEWATLTARTGNALYEEHTNHVFDAIYDRARESGAPRGLFPHMFNPDTGRFAGGVVSFGALGDSFYEYLVKCWRSLGALRRADRWREMFDDAMAGMKSHLLHEWKRGTNGEVYAYVSPVGGAPKMEHLACFVPGMLVLGAAEAPTEMADEYLEMAKNIARTCVEMYTSQPTGLSPDHASFPSGGNMTLVDRKNIQRPETVESLFYLYRKTGDDVYRDQAWTIFQAMKRTYRAPSGGWQGVHDVSVDPPRGDDKMQSFFLAETLKYLYLIFCEDSVMHLDEWVFNTEAHPFKMTRDVSTLGSRSAR